MDVAVVGVLLSFKVYSFLSTALVTQFKTVV